MDASGVRGSPESDDGGFECDDGPPCLERLAKHQRESAQGGYACQVTRRADGTLFSAPVDIRGALASIKLGSAGSQVSEGVCPCGSRSIWLTHPYQLCP
jgi:hypothetical protein